MSEADTTQAGGDALGGRRFFDFLGGLRDKARAGLRGASPEFRRRHARWLAARILPDGGFADRAGGSSLYYTAFGLRALSVLDALSPETARGAARFLLALVRRPAGERDEATGGAFYNAVSVSAWWDAVRLCEEVVGPVLNAADAVASVACARLDSLRRDDGGWAKTPVETDGSLYHSFLAVCAYGRMKKEPPASERLGEFLNSLAAPEGGFLENRHVKRPGVNGTAAGVSLGLLLGVLKERRRHAEFLRKHRADCGGFYASVRAPWPDLLSTFTALVALKNLGAAEVEVFPGAASFAGRLEGPEGGYVGCEPDSTADAEYTFYGLGTAGLVADCAAGQAAGGSDKAAETRRETGR